MLFCLIETKQEAQELSCYAYIAKVQWQAINESFCQLRYSPTQATANLANLWIPAYRQGDLDQLVRQVRAQLKKIAITDKSRVDEMFLRYDRDRTGYISVENMRDLCRRLQLPVDDDVILAVSVK